MTAPKLRPADGQDSTVISFRGDPIFVPEPRESWMGEGHTFLRAAAEVRDQQEKGRNASCAHIREALAVLYPFHLSDKRYFLRVITPETVLRLRNVAERVSGTSYREGAPDWARPILLFHELALFRVSNANAKEDDFVMAHRLCVEMAVEAQRALYSR